MRQIRWFQSQIEERRRQGEPWVVIADTMETGMVEEEEGGVEENTTTFPIPGATVGDEEMVVALGIEDLTRDLPITWVHFVKILLG